MHAGDPTATLKNGALVGVVNLILDPILMFPMGLGTAGAAIG
jgi:Na+-driven multidrug efflux pump